MSSSSTITILFTDLVGSTELTVRVGAERFDAIRRDQFGTFRAVIAAFEGNEIKTLGDGVMAAFTSTVGALGCAVAMQRCVDQANRRSDIALAIRVGVSVGEATTEDGDWFGVPVVEAARLCSAAGGGQILVTDLVRRLAGDRAAQRFGSVDALVLKGFAEPVTACQVEWRDREPPAIPIPPALSAGGRRVFVGREPELARLDKAWAQAVAGQAGLVLVAGEPGVGKTRLLAEFASAAHTRRASVLYGRCDEDAVVAYQPFVEAIGQYVALCPVEGLVVDVARCGNDLGRLLPELRDRLPTVQPRPTGDLDAERQAMFDAVACLIRSVAERAPVVMVLDDLHWATTPTLLLLRHLLDSLGGAPVMVIASFRDTELRHDHPLGELVADLRGGPELTNLALTGLDETGVAAYLEAAAGHGLELAELDVARVLHNETDGNPFFLGQLLRHFVESGAIAQEQDRWVWRASIEDLAVPAGVRDVVRRRLSRLPDATTRMLAFAAVIGHEFSLDVLERVGGLGDHVALLDAIDPAVEARLVLEVGGVPGRYNFSHALVRHTLYGDLTAGRRAWMHQQIAEASELSPGPIEAKLASLAHHFCAAAHPGNTTKAADYSYRAGRQALDGLAFEQAIPVLNRGLQALTLDDQPDLERRADLLLALAEAWLPAGEVETARTFALRSAADARSVGSPVRLARVAVAGNVQRNFGMSPEFDAMAAEALAGLGEDQPGLRAQLLNALAEYRQWFLGDADQAADLARQAIELAREAGDDDALAQALLVVATHRTATGSERAADQVALADELKDLAIRTGDGTARMLALEAGASSRLELGDRAGFDADAAELARLSNELRSPIHQSFATMWRAVQALLAGDFAGVEAIAGQLYPYARDNGAWTKSHAILVLHALREQGRLDEAGPLLPLAMEDSQVAGIHAAPLVVHLGLGDHDAVAHDLDEFAADEFAGVPIAWTRTLTMSLLAEACAVLADDERASALRGLLSPHSGHHIIAGVGVICVGAADRFLAMLEATMHRWADAEEHFEAALALEQSTNSPAFMAHTRYWYARCLVQQGQHDRSAQLLLEALNTVDSLGMTDLSRRVRALLMSPHIRRTDPATAEAIDKRPP
jgi:class 3 adenylate cyclase/tetratricopeptide (TPR) repeat protein